MSTDTTTVPAVNRVTFGRILASETLKLVTVRSTWWTAGITVLLSLLMGLLLGTTLSHSEGALPLEARQSLTVTAATAGVLLTQLVVGVLGVLTIGGEYATGYIRSSVAAAPTRLQLVLGKTVVVALLGLVLGLASVFAGWATSAPGLGAKGASAPLGDPVVLGHLLVGACYLALVAVMSFGIGLIVRATAAGIAIVAGLLFVAPIVFALIPADWAHSTGARLPSSLGQSLYMVSSGAPEVPTAIAWLLLVLWAAVPVAIGTLLFRFRDV